MSLVPRRSFLALMGSISLCSTGCSPSSAERVKPPSDSQPLILNGISGLDWTLNGVKNPHEGKYKLGQTLMLKGTVKPAASQGFIPGGFGKGHALTAVFLKQSKNPTERIAAQSAMQIDSDPQGKTMGFQGSIVAPNAAGEYEFEVQLLEKTDHPSDPSQLFYKASPIHRFRVTVE